MQNLFYQIIIYTHEIIVKYFFDGSVVWMISWVVHFYLFSAWYGLSVSGDSSVVSNLIPYPTRLPISIVLEQRRSLVNGSGRPYLVMFFRELGEELGVADTPLLRVST